MDKDKDKNLSEEYTLRDFTKESFPGTLEERITGFQKWIDQSARHDHQIFWNEAITGIRPEMTVLDPLTQKKTEVISFISNDYLGMSQRPEVISAGIEAVHKYGTGACAAPIIGGYLDIHRQLEEEIAAFTGQEDALIFSSGFGVNVGVLNAIMGKEDIAYVDLKVHTSVMDGLYCTNVKRVKHNDPEYLEFVLKNAGDSYKTKLVIVDGVYSQDGDICPLPEIKSVCDKYGALLFVDDAHGMGVFGDNGKGIVEHFGMLGQVDIITGTFSKSFGCVGGFVSCSKKLSQYLRYYANTNVFSAAVTPQVTMSVLKSLELIKTQPDIRKKLWNNVEYLRKRLKEEGFDYGDTVSPIFPIMVRNPYKVKEITRLLMHKGIYALGIVFPAVTNANSRVRVSLLASHEISQLEKLVCTLMEIRNTIKF